MKSEQKLIISRNLLRYIITEMGEEFNNRCTEDHGFFNHVVHEGQKIKLIKERSPGVYAITGFEKYNNPRHKGKAQHKHRLL